MPTPHGRRSWQRDKLQRLMDRLVPLTPLAASELERLSKQIPALIRRRWSWECPDNQAERVSRAYLKLAQMLMDSPGKPDRYYIACAVLEAGQFIFDEARHYGVTEWALRKGQPWRPVELRETDLVLA